MWFTKRPRHLPHNAVWRSVVSVLLVALVAFAPIARAVCDLQHIATATAGLHDDVATVGDSNPDSHDQDSGWCCDEGSDLMAPDFRTSAVDADAALSLPTLHLAPVASFYLALTSARFEFSGGRPPPPPYEPTFRRVRRLLI